MLLTSLLIIPFIGIFIISSNLSYRKINSKGYFIKYYVNNKKIALTTSIINMVISFIIFILYDFNNNQFQFVQEHYTINLFDVYLGIDGVSIYFVLLTTLIIPIAILSN